MRRVRALARRAAGLFIAGRADREMREEFESHLQLHIDDNVRAGMTPSEARRQALLKFGPLESIKESYRDVASLPLLTGVVRDAVFGLRTLRREPVFTVGVIVTLALGIGANTAVFSVADPILLRPLPYLEPARIVEIADGGQSFAMFGKGIEIWPPELKQNPAFSAMGLYIAGEVNLGGEPATRVPAATATPEFFTVLGVLPVRGRWYTEHDIKVSDRVAVISHSLWREKFSGDPDVVGRQLTLDSVPFAVVGVMPEGVTFPDGAVVWVPTSAPTQIDGYIPTPNLIARLAPGVTIEQARAVVLGLPGLEKRTAGRVRVVSIREALVGKIRSIALVVWLAAALVLLVACMNATNLLLARVSRREREFAVRRALGATRPQLIRQVITESLVLSGLAAVVAIPAAIWPLEVARSLLPPTLHGATDIALNARAFAATAGLALVTTLLFGLAPAVSIQHRPAIDVLRAQATTTSDRFWRRFRSGLLMAQIAIAVVLLTSAAAIVKNVRAVLAVDMGVSGERAVAFEVSPPRSKYRSPDALRAFYARLEEAIRAVPGVAEFGVTDQLPGRASMMLARAITAEGLSLAPGDKQRAVRLTASPGYFSASGIQLLAGRGFRASDGPGSPRVVIVSESYARALGVRPEQLVGRRSVAGSKKEPLIEEIVGVVRDVRLHGPEKPVQPAAYLPHAVDPGGYQQAYVVVRAVGDPSLIVPALRAAMTRVDPDLPLFNVQTFDEIRASLLAGRRFAMTTIAAFGLLAFVLASIGLYGVISYLVQLRTREIGIRLAIGATRIRICRQVLAGGLAHAIIGIGAGIAIALASSHVLAAGVQGVDGIDAGILSLMAGVVAAVAFVATLVPAWRAMRIDPARTLRAD